jgi:hypothetical protein
MTTVNIAGRWLLGSLVLACVLSACIARLNEMGAPASQAAGGDATAGHRTAR